MANLLNYYSNWKEDRELLYGETACIVPFECCFLNSCPLPKDAKTNEAIEAIASINLESSSPFPLEDIFWGYFLDRKNAVIHIFSALKSRVKALNSDAAGATYIIPDFVLPIVDKTIEKAVLKYGDFTTVFQREADGSCSFSSSKAPADYPVLEITEAKAVREFGLVITYTWKENSSIEEGFKKKVELPFHDALLYSVNMQNSAMKKVTKQTKITANATRLVSVSAVIVSLVTLGTLFFIESLQIKQNLTAKKLQGQEKTVELIQQKDERAHELELFSKRKQAYFRGLNQLNSLRPDSILFQDLYASEGENFEIKALATSLDEMEKFRKTLENSEQFKTVKLTREGFGDNERIRFSLSLTFKKL